MRLILLYDIPMTEEKDRKIYQQFHRKLSQFGFSMLQYSIYVKVLPNEDSYRKIMIKLNQNIPQIGNMILFRLTERQYQDMVYLNGEQNKFDLIVGGKELVVFGGDEDSRI